MSRFAAIDLGASSGRVMVADVRPDGVDLREVHRVPNRPVRVGATLHWDVLALWAGALDGLRAAAADGELAGVAVVSWAIDYALLDADGRLLGNPVHYRDQRTDGVAEHLAVPPAELFAATGVQPLPFNTVFQLAAARQDWALGHAACALLMPDLIGYWLTGERSTELTNASTTGLVDARTRSWAPGLAEQLDVAASLFPPLREPGTVLGILHPELARDCGTGPLPVTSVASHDTASAVLGVPATDGTFAFLSCGTWSLIGVELTEPVVTEQARLAGFSNELGVDGTVRFLRNIMGLWLLQECVRTWERDGVAVDLPRLLAEAARIPAGRSVIDPDRPEFLPPGDMPARIEAECRRTGQPVPGSAAELTRCILDSLAAAYRRAVDELAALTGTRIEVVHLVGGGAQNDLLCQLTADACELPVVAGPVEAAAYGNVLLQARTAGVLDGDRWALRRVVAAGAELRRFLPR